MSDNTQKSRWYPLESNPELMNAYINNLGFDTSYYQFVDLFSTDEWALEMIPQPCTAVIMLYPITKVQEEWRKEEQRLLEEQKQAQSETDSTADDLKDVWYIKQRIGNACGTIGILHALANIPAALKTIAISQDSWLGTFLDTTPPSLSPITKAELLESDTKIEKLHDAATSDSTNATNRGNLNDKVETHFVAIVNVNGNLVELDGRKEGPILHGKTTEMTFLKDACKNVVKKFMDRDPNEVRFTMLALAPSQN